MKSTGILEILDEFSVKIKDNSVEGCIYDRGSEFMQLAEKLGTLMNIKLKTSITMPANGKKWGNLKK